VIYYIKNNPNKGRKCLILTIMLNNLLDPFKKNRCTVIDTQNIKQTQLMASINIKKIIQEA